MGEPERAETVAGRVPEKVLARLSLIFAQVEHGPGPAVVDREVDSDAGPAGIDPEVGLGGVDREVRPEAGLAGDDWEVDPEAGFGVGREVDREAGIAGIDREAEFARAMVHSAEVVATGRAPRNLIERARRQREADTLRQFWHTPAAAEVAQSEQDILVTAAAVVVLADGESAASVDSVAVSAAAASAGTVVAEVVSDIQRDHQLHTM